MQQTTRPLLALALATLIGAAPALAPAEAGAQGKGNKHGHHKAKHNEDNDFRRGDRDRWRRLRDDDRADRRRDRPLGYSDGGVTRLTPLRLQEGRRGTQVRVPPGHLPPPGLCRIWIAGVPPGRQPAPTDCATALRNRPANARVIYGPGVARARHYGATPRVGRVGTVGDRGVPSQPVYRDSRLPDGTRVVVARDDRCADVDGDGRRERVTYLPPGQIPRSVCR